MYKKIIATIFVMIVFVFLNIGFQSCSREMITVNTQSNSYLQKTAPVLGENKTTTEDYSSATVVVYLVDENGSQLNCDVPGFFSYYDPASDDSLIPKIKQLKECRQISNQDIFQEPKPVHSFYRDSDAAKISSPYIGIYQPVGYKINYFIFDGCNADKSGALPDRILKEVQNKNSIQMKQYSASINGKTRTPINITVDSKKCVVFQYINDFVNYYGNGGKDLNATVTGKYFELPMSSKIDSSSLMKSDSTLDGKFLFMSNITPVRFGAERKNR